MTRQAISRAVVAGLLLCVAACGGFVAGGPSPVDNAFEGERSHGRP